MLWVTASQGKESDEVFVEFDLAPDQAMSPMPIYRKVSAQKMDDAPVSRAPKKNNLARDGRAGTGRPTCWKRSTRWWI